MPSLFPTSRYILQPVSSKNLQPIRDVSLNPKSCNALHVFAIASRSRLCHSYSILIACPYPKSGCTFYLGLAAITKLGMEKDLKINGCRREYPHCARFCYASMLISQKLWIWSNFDFHCIEQRPKCWFAFNSPPRLPGFEYQNHF